MRSLARAVLLCLAGAGLAVYGGTRTWSILVTERPGLSELRSTSTGAAHAPWLVALAVVALAGGGALLATKGWARRALGGLLALAGLGVIAAAITGRAGIDAGRAATSATVWSLACAFGGALVVVAGVAAARHGHLWPAMGSRYERSQAPAAPADAGAGSEPLPPAGRTIAETETRAAWDALDHGVDPTA
jgi:uncharacterized membrane protein (TIGR02234 family)